MIFVAVGTQFAFNRLIEYMDEWAAEHDEPVIAQIGTGDYEPKHVEFTRYLDNQEYNQCIGDARIFVSHAGMGNILSARDRHTPIIVMNRQFALGEHRNDHQAEGLPWMGKLDGVSTATTQTELYQAIDNIGHENTSNEQSNASYDKLIDYLRTTIQQI